MKICIVMPAYNAGRTLEKTIKDIPLSIIDEIIFVDDASTDDTQAIVMQFVQSHSEFTFDVNECIGAERKILFTYIRHTANTGYGGNQKTCYRTALLHTADVVVMIHPDFQYDPTVIPALIQPLQTRTCDVMFGSRIRTKKECLAGSMPIYKYYANRILSAIENMISGQKLSEWHTGMRAYTRKVLEVVPLETFSDDFVFDTQMTFGCIERGFAIGEVPVPVRYFSEASSINLQRSIKYGIATLYETAVFLLRKTKKIFRYIIAGGIGALTNLAIYALCLYTFRLWYVPASIIGFCAGIGISFTLQKYWTFKRANREGALYEALTYFSIACLNLLITIYLLIFFIETLHLGKMFANILAGVCVALWSYILYTVIVFKKRK